MSCLKMGRRQNVTLCRVEKLVYLEFSKLFKTHLLKHSIFQQDKL